MYSVDLYDLINEIDLEIVYRPTDVEKIAVSGIEINRPGLQLTGFYQDFFPSRIQVLGEQEKEYLLSLDQKTRYERLDRLFSSSIPAFIIANNIYSFPEITELAMKHEVLVLKTELPTSRFISKIIGYLEDVLAPSTTMHGVLLEVFGMGVIITGKSGIGKSEVALELIKLGHRLVADDAVEIKKIDDMLRGTSPALIKHFMEIRGIGIIDVTMLYGVGAVKTWEMIDLMVELEDWDEDKEYDRLGIEEQTIDILGIQTPKVTIPVRPGRHLAMIVEVAARNTRMKQFGHNAAEELDRKLREDIELRKKTYNWEE